MFSKHAPLLGAQYLILLLKHENTQCYISVSMARTALQMACFSSFAVFWSVFVVLILDIIPKIIIIIIERMVVRAIGRSFHSTIDKQGIQDQSHDYKTLWKVFHTLLWFCVRSLRFAWSKNFVWYDFFVSTREKSMGNATIVFCHDSLTP